MQTRIRLAIGCLLFVALSTGAQAAGQGNAIILQVSDKPVTMYKESHPHSIKITVVPKHERWLIQEARKIHTNGVWCKVDYKGKKGWVKRKYLSEDSQAILIAQKHKHCLTPTKRDKVCFMSPDSVAKQ